VSVAKWFMLVLCVILIAVIASMGCVNGLTFKAKITDNLKLAGDAPSIERADAFLVTALNAIEARGLNSGNAALIFQMPSSDMGIWYQQIKGARLTTSTLISKKTSGQVVTQLEQDNALMKIRETVLDQGKEGVSVTGPDNAWIYPLQWMFYMLIWVLAICAIVTVALFAADAA
jgi:hypothetical protein